MLIVAPASAVDNWAGVAAFWGGPELNVVPYVGSSAARTAIHDHELWLAPESLDTKTSTWLRQGLPARVRARACRLPLASCFSKSWWPWKLCMQSRADAQKS